MKYLTDEQVHLREKNRPKITLIEQLPITEYYEKITSTISKNQVTIIAGETGSGKTTQLPKFCLNMGLGIRGYIGHTQPRRLAARSIAARIAEELNSPLGQYVGYKVRFNTRFDDSAYIKVMTDGILLNEIQHDRYLRQYDTLIIDEAHERSLNIDFILGYIKKILPKRPDLKIIITSATIDVERFSKHFNHAPIIQVSGRVYPVEICYRPESSLVNAVEELIYQGPGDILIFQSGEREIRETLQRLEKLNLPNIGILPLYSRLSLHDQYKIFHQQQMRRIILATNIAETSITVPGIRYVIDPGYARVSRYSSRSKVQRLPIEAISQASAKQRTGRCGRVQNGICIRLYSEENYLSRPEYTEPEILRTNLAAVILQLKALNLGKLDQFPFIQLPEANFINDGYKLLYEIKAIDEQQHLTHLGQAIAKFPIDPSLAAMLIAAKQYGCLAELLVVVSFLSIQDPREKPLEKRQQAAEKHRIFQEESSDFLTIINIWTSFHEQAKQLSKNQLEKYCKQNYLSYLRMREWQDVHKQLLALSKEHKMILNQVPADYATIHRAILVGCLRYVACKEEKLEYKSTRNIKCQISPASTLYKKQPNWIMAASLLETERTYAQIVAKIEPEWIEELAGHLLKRSYFEPHWEKKKGFVVAYEKAILFGLIINPKKKVNYGPIDPVISREIFIREGLMVESENKATRMSVFPPLGRGIQESSTWRDPADKQRDDKSKEEVQSQSNQQIYSFLRNNFKLINEIEDLEHRSRRRDLLVHNEVIFHYYESIIPDHIYDKKTFEDWYSKAQQRDAKCLFLTRDYLLTKTADYDIEKQFPQVINISGHQLKLSYYFSPGERNDGVTVHIPVEAINQIPLYQWEWLVPGMLEEKVTLLIKSLPKNYRKLLVPVPEIVQSILKNIEPENKKICPILGQKIKLLYKINIPDDLWDENKLPSHLKMNFAIIEKEGKRLATSHDLTQLREQFRSKLDKSTELSSLPYEKRGIIKWDFGSLEETIIENTKNYPITRFVTLVDEETSVSIRCMDNIDVAKWHMRRGVLRLLCLTLANDIKYCVKNIQDSKTLGLLFVPIGTYQQLAADLQLAVFQEVFIQDPWAIRSEELFLQQIGKNKPMLIETFNKYVQVLRKILELIAEVRGNLKKISDKNLKQDIEFQINNLVFVGFLQSTPNSWLKRLPIYLSAINLRLSKDKKIQHAEQILFVQKFWDLYQKRKSEYEKLHYELPLELMEFRFMLEELRISFFAQPLKTLVPVSEKRIKSMWELIVKNHNM